MTAFVHLAGARLASLSGHVILLKAGVPQEVPAHMEGLARQLGCVPAKEVNPAVLEALAGVSGDVPGPKAVDTPEPAAETEDTHRLITDAIDVVMARGDEADLTKDKSRPRLASVRAELPPGVEITSEQLDAALGNL